MEKNGQENNKRSHNPLYVDVSYSWQVEGGTVAGPEILKELDENARGVNLNIVDDEDAWKKKYFDKITRLNKNAESPTKLGDIQIILDEIAKVNIHGRIDAKKLFDRAVDLYEKACTDRYIRTGKRQLFNLHLFFLTYVKFFDPFGRLCNDFMYQETTIGNCIIEAFYLELKEIGAERTFRNVLLNILLLNGQNRTALYTRIFNDKTTRS